MLLFGLLTFAVDRMRRAKPSLNKQGKGQNAMQTQLMRSPGPLKTGQISTLKLISLAAVVLLSGCAATGQDRVTEKTEFVTVDTSCSWARPIYIGPGDVLTEQTGRAILSHNETGKKRCGWKRSKPKD